MSFNEYANSTGYTFDDYLLVPQYSDIYSRSEVDVSTTFCGETIKSPIIPANMDTITGQVMGVVLLELGQAPIFHRYMKPSPTNTPLLVRGTASIGVRESDLYIAAELRAAGARSICVDVAHGHQKQVGETISRLRDMGYQYIIAGNVATYEGAKYLADCGATYVKVGVGPGSVCVTRDMTGHGVPQLTAIMEAARGIRTSGNTKAGLIADGGIRTPGDVAKALAAGADLVMSGFIFAGCNETPNPGSYRGMASRQTQVEHRGFVSNGTPEGVSIGVESKGPVVDVFELFKGGLRSALTYSGCRTLKEFKEGAILRPVSSHTVIENGVRR